MGWLEIIVAPVVLAGLGGLAGALVRRALGRTGPQST